MSRGKLLQWGFILVFLFTVMLFYCVPVGATSIFGPPWNASDIQVNGSASIGSSLILNRGFGGSGPYQGSAFYKQKISLKNNRPFSICMYVQNYLEGFAFVIQPNSPTQLGSASNYGGENSCGYLGIPSSVAVAFRVDSRGSGETVYIGKNGSMTDVNYVSGRVDGVYHRKWIWIDYDGIYLEIRRSMDGERPEVPLVRYPIDIVGYTGDDVYIGFTGCLQLVGKARPSSNVIQNWIFMTKDYVYTFADNAVVSTDGRKVLVTCRDEMATPPPAPAGFTVNVNGVNYPVASISVNSANKKIIELALGKTIYKDDKNINLSYTPGTVGATNGSKLVSVSNLNVTNNSTVLPNQAPSINFTSLPVGFKVHKAETSLNFSIKATDPDPKDQNLDTEFYLDTGGGFKKVASFTANGTTYPGVFSARNGTEYAIAIKKTPTLIPTNVNSFKLKAVTKDSDDAQSEKIVNLSHYNTDPTIEITGLTTNQKISKHEPKFSFNITPRDPDTIDEDLNVELYLVIEGKETRVNNFTAGGAEITDGNLAAKSNQTYNITIDKSLPADNPLLPNTVDKFTLKAVVRDGCQAQGTREIPLIHDNAVPVVEITGLTDNQRIRKSENILEFGIKVTDDDTADANLETEIYIGIFGTYQKITEFTIDGVQNTVGKLTAQNGTEYTITLNKGVIVPFYADSFTLKVIATDTCGEKGEKELSLIHYTDILAQWSLDSVKERIAVESSGNNNHGVIHGATLTTGIISNALEFDGTDDYISIPGSSFNKLSDWTFEAWVKPVGPGYIYSEGNPAATMVIEMKNDNSVNIGTWHHERTGNWNWFNSGANALTRDVWNYLVVTLENGTEEAGSGTAKCYVNGVLVAQPEPGSLGKEYNLATKEAALGGNVGIKAGQGLNPFSGCLDEVTLYGCALSALEVERNYQKVVFLENIKMTDVSDPNKKTADCLLGSSIQNKLEFDLTKPVTKLTLELNLPNNISINRVDKILPENVEMENVTIKGRRIILEQPLAVGHYELELFLALDTKLDLTTKSYSDQNEITTNYECVPFVLQVVDFPDLL